MAQPSNTYSVARIHALESQLMDKMKIERMVEAASAEDALKILGESGEYGAAMSDLQGPWEYEKVLEAELKSLKELLEKISPNLAVSNLFFMHHDVNNVKVMIKAKTLGREFPEFISPFGAIDLVVFNQAFKDDDFAALPAYLQEAIYDVRSEMDEKVDPQKMDVILDRAMYAEILRIAKKEKMPAIMNYFRKEIDWINILSFFRTNRAGFGSHYFSGVYIPGGTINERSFWKGIDENMDLELDVLSGTEYRDMFAESLALYRDSGNLSILERNIQNRMLEEIKRLSQNNYSGIEPVLGYLLAKEYEAKAVRLIMVGKLNGLPKEVIKERLRECYA
ncbi:V-type ATP synthase subunit C [Clostridia bacterium]|nr:V-type ATP synthase subunit C [Clostridia bacterium]